MNKSYEYFQKYLNLINKENLYPTIHTIDGPSCSPQVKINGKEYLSFVSNNYLGLANNGEVKKAVVDGVNNYGVGSGSTRLLSGTLDVQVLFEKELASFLGYDDVITFSSGYLANVGVIRMLVDRFPYFHLPFEKEGLIISDELNHASIIDGIRLAKSERVVYPHGDMIALEKILIKNKNRRKLIISDGVFSMDGDFADVVNISKLSKQYDALFMLDDSHGIGVLGPNGEGLPKHLGLHSVDVDILMGSFTKAFGSIGGFVAVNKTLSDYLRITARSYIFSDPIPPAFVQGLRIQTKLIREGRHLRENLFFCTKLLRDGLKNLGFKVYGQESNIVPLVIGNEKKTMQFAGELFNNGILAPAIRKPAVLEGQERIRFSVTALHKKQDIERLLLIAGKIGKNLGLVH